MRPVDLVAVAFLVAALLLGLSAADTPNPVYSASSYMTKLRSGSNGTLYKVSGPSATDLNVLHVYGDARARGLAQGRLLSAEVLEFVETALPAFYKSEAAQIPLDKLPAWLAKAIKALAEAAAPKAFDLALGWVLSQQKDLIAASPAKVFDEIQGMAEGVCAAQRERAASTASASSSSCDAASLAKTLEKVNMLPELLQMQCSMMGAWGKAVPGGRLVQLRSLDFGGGPFANRSVLVVHHPPSPAHGFASLGFPGFVGAVTGVSQALALSEKVDDVTGGPRPPGSYKGQAVSMVLRDFLQFATSPADAVAIARRAKRTWSVWLGVGDMTATPAQTTTNQPFIAMKYTKASVVTYDDTNMTLATNQTVIPDVTYIDKHPQPSPHPDMPTLARKFYGNMTAVNVATNFPRVMRSGDLHTAIYDAAAQRLYVSTGTTDETGNTYTRLACDAPYLEFDLAALWGEPCPANNNQ